MEITKELSVSPLANYADHELLELMAMKEDKDTTDQAFHAFYGRFKQTLYDVINLICSTYTNREELSQIVFNNAFYKAYHYAHTFSAEGETQPEIIKLKIIGWLVVIAKNDLKAQFSSNNKVDKQKEETVYRAMLQRGRNSQKQETYNEKIVRQAMDQIPKERDREIFFMYWLFYEEGGKGQAKKLPDYVYDELCAKYNTTEQNVRQIISRTNRIVKEYLQKHYKK